MNANFWHGKHVLITGHTGFKGSWLTFWLNELGAKVSGISLAPETSDNAFTALDLEPRCANHFLIDIRNREEVQGAIKSLNPEILFHMAAQPLVRRSYAEPLETYETNVMGTANVLMAARDCASLRSAVIVTTDKCYENREWAWGYRESDALGGHDPYSSSKACAEILTSSFRRSFFAVPGRNRIGLASVRAGNVIGGGDWSQDRLIPDLVRSTRTGDTMEIRSPMAIRPWQHVLSPLSGYLSLAEHLFTDPLKYSEAYNFAPADDDCVPVRTLIEMFESSWGKSLPWRISDGPHPHESHFLKLDSSKARADLAWRPQWNLAQALTATAEWYRTYYEIPGAMAALTRRQISAYSKINNLQAESRLQPEL